MVDASPRSNAPGVAFEIPIEKKEPNTSSPSIIQQRLAAQADSPRRELSLKDIHKKLEEATNRKNGKIKAAKAKTHNAKVEKVYEKSKEEENDKSKALENHIRAKLGNAEAKRDGLTNNWVRRLSFMAKEKLRRAAKVRNDEKWSAKELETKIDVKEMSAELRREELKLKTQEQLAISNHDKLRRGQLALGMAEIEAKKYENRSDQKIESANHRRDMQHILVSARIGEATAAKREKVAETRQQEEEEARKREAEMTTKIRLAEERKRQSVAGKVKSASARFNDKMQRVADVRRQQDETVKEKDEHSRAKIESARQRREHLMLEQQLMLQKSASKKERLVDHKEDEEEKASVQKQKEIQSKILSANARKDEILVSKVKRAQTDQKMKKQRVKNTWLASLNDSKELQRTSEKRQKGAAERKNKFRKERVVAFEGVNKSKIDKIDKMKTTSLAKERRDLVEIQKRLDVASVNRENNLVAKSSSKKRMLSPRTSPTNKNEIEARINSANLRREICLATKAEKAKKGKDSPVKKTLFASVSPKQIAVGRSREARTPRIKAQRLEEFKEKSILESGQTHISGLSVPLMTIGGMAVVLVGLLSFLKSK